MFARAASQQRQANTRDKVFPAPVRGWVQSGSLATAGEDQAEVLDNFICTAQGARVRGGATEYGDFGAPIVRLFTYSHPGASRIFVATATKVFFGDRVAGGDPNTFAELEGLSSGDWSSTQISTSGGVFTIAVNGANKMIYYDLGAEFEVISSAATNELSFDAEVDAFTVGDTITGDVSGATAVILAISKSSTTAGKLKLGAITSGPFQNNEQITGALSGDALANGASAAASTIAITGVNTEDLSQVWSFKNRLFFVENGGSSAWYLPVNSLGGTATEFPLGSVFRKGGGLLFGASWSLDSGEGLDDVCLFVSANGEIAVYEGTDPSDSAAWSLVGVYEIGKPINKHSFFKAGGDLAIVTDEGIVPVSEAIKKDRAALQGVAITYPIEDAWRSVVANGPAYPVTATLWQSKTLLLVGTGGTEGNLPVSFAANARTGAWSRIIGWDVRCAAVHQEQGTDTELLYFGNNDGKVMIADSGGTDDGASFQATYIAKASQCGTPNYKSATHAGITYKALGRVPLRLAAFGDYNIGSVSPGDVATALTASTWGTGVWGSFVWGNSAISATMEWQAVSAGGNALAPALAVLSGETAALSFEIVSTHLRFEPGTVF